MSCTGSLPLTFSCLLQQLYIFGGLLMTFACINAFPLATLTRLVRIGALWQVAGEAHDQIHRVLHGSDCQVCMPCPG